jgi:hypothetical protein
MWISLLYGCISAYKSCNWDLTPRRCVRPSSGERRIDHGDTGCFAGMKAVPQIQRSKEPIRTLAVLRI